MKKKISNPKTIQVEVSYIEQIYAEVCQEWKNKLESKFPQLNLSPKGKFYIYGDDEIILITCHPNFGIIVKAPTSSRVGKFAEFNMSFYKPYTGPKIDLNKIFNNY